jgi:hypothetical protein
VQAAATDAPKEETVGLTSGCFKSALTVPQKDSSKEKKAEKRDARQSAVKVGRRLSSRVGEFFKAKKFENTTQAKVDENPPTIDKPEPVAPLEHPATAGSADNTDAPASGEPKTEAPPAVPVVAAAA